MAAVRASTTDRSSSRIHSSRRRRRSLRLDCPQQCKVKDGGTAPKGVCEPGRSQQRGRATVVEPHTLSRMQAPLRTDFGSTLSPIKHSNVASHASCQMSADRLPLAGNKVWDRAKMGHGKGTGNSHSCDRAARSQQLRQDLHVPTSATYRTDVTSLPSSLCSSRGRMSRWSRGRGGRGFGEKGDSITAKDKARRRTRVHLHGHPPGIGRSH